MASLSLKKCLANFIKQKVRNKSETYIFRKYKNLKLKFIKNLRLFCLIRKNRQFFGDNKKVLR